MKMAQIWVKLFMFSSIRMRLQFRKRWEITLIVKETQMITSAFGTFSVSAQTDLSKLLRRRAAMNFISVCGCFLIHTKGRGITATCGNI